VAKQTVVTGLGAARLAQGAAVVVAGATFPVSGGPSGRFSSWWR
jgi:hypothetical protein